MMPLRRGHITRKLVGPHPKVMNVADGAHHRARMDEHDREDVVHKFYVIMMGKN